MSLSHEIVIPMSLSADGEFLLFASNYNQSSVEKISIISPNTVAKDAVNYATISILDKGADGAQNDVVVEKDTDTNNVASIDFTANVKRELELSTPYKLHYGLTLKLASAAAQVDLGIALVSIVVRQ